MTKTSSSLASTLLRKAQAQTTSLIFPNYKVTRQVLVNSCGYAVLRNVNISSLNLPTATGGRADFTYANLPVAQALSCAKGTLYFPKGFDAKQAIASATTATTTTASTTGSTASTTTTQAAASTTSTVTSQRSQLRRRVGTIWLFPVFRQGLIL